MDKVSLPGDAWAQLRDPDTVTERQRKPFVTAIGRVAKADGMDDGGMGALFDVQDCLVLAMVQEWSFEFPVTADGLLDLPHKAISALRVECAKFQDELMPDFGPTKDPDTPTAPSND